MVPRHCWCEFFSVRFDDLWRKYQTYNAGEELFGLQVTEYPHMQRTKKELNLLQKLYGLYNSVMKSINGYYDILWSEVDIDKINQELLDFQNRFVLFWRLWSISRTWPVCALGWFTNHRNRQQQLYVWIWRLYYWVLLLEYRPFIWQPLRHLPFPGDDEGKFRCSLAFSDVVNFRRVWKNGGLISTYLRRSTTSTKRVRFWSWCRTKLWNRGTGIASPIWRGTRLMWVSQKCCNSSGVPVTVLVLIAMSDRTRCVDGLCNSKMDLNEIPQTF